MSNEEFEINISTLLKRQYRLNIEESCFSTGYIPKYILLDRTRNIHSYLLFCRSKENNIYGPFWQIGKAKIAILNVLRTQFSKLDRPMFFIIQNNEKDLKIIEGNFVREHLLEFPDLDIDKFLLTQSDNFQDVIYDIKKEL